MKKIFSILCSVLILVSCEELTDLNENPKRPLAVAHETLFSNAQLRLTNELTNSNVNRNIFRLLAQQWTQTTYIDESNYDLTTREIPENFWNRIYRDVLQDLKESDDLLADAELDAPVKANQQAMIDILEVYTNLVLVNIWGDIPYEEALDSDNILPEYNDAKEIYLMLIAKLDDALDMIAIDEAGFGESDLFYGDDVDVQMEKWLKLGNSLKLKIGLLLADEDVMLATTLVEEAAPNVFESNADNTILHYSTVPPNTNPIWVDLVQSGRKDYVAANTFIDALDSLSDPRMPYYFTKDSEDNYSGGTYGSDNSYSAFSKPGDMILEPGFEAIMFDYAEVEFMLAEAVERGMSVAGTAEEHYNYAITASMEYWGVSPADITTYLANPYVAYTTAEGDYKQKIGMQKWFALYNRGYEAWTEWRRLDYPVLVAPEEAVSDVPLRFTYPTNEQNLNTINYEAAAESIGGDVVTTKLFWDVN